MAAPLVAKFALSQGLKPALRILVFGVAGIAGALLLSLPLALGVVSASTVPTPPANAAGGPLIVGDWGAPQSGYYETAHFGYPDRSDCFVCSTFHKGIDLTAGCGSPVYAAGSGTVVAAGWNSGGYGNWVNIDHGGGYVTVYGHMPNGGVLVQEGQTVVAGDQIGLEGSTGFSTGCHLHFELDIDGVPVDPRPFMLQHGISL
ncbi:M23 family metallopeptidase [Salinibacterium sp. UTAS2018]|uniref:M23 family metallopeptidase n=1 Tax=Salinibacterium sp. UTAS2018 TaxID=2508880 RepID=UPI0010098313|nr:M23 family metallopeptidase [Salinibacterium sp. UTAS2018]QAV70031.1 M23 family metallopeptidase [Salinibacterium sp. UTAS2018]